MRSSLSLVLLLALPACSSGGSIGDPRPADDDDSAADDDDTSADDDDTAADDDDTVADDDDNPWQGAWVGEIWLTNDDSDQAFCSGWGDLTIDASGEFASEGYCETFNGGEIWIDTWGEIRASGDLGGVVWTEAQWNGAEGEYELAGGPGDARALLFYWRGEILRPNGQPRPYEGHAAWWIDEGDEPPPGN
jgi:hypothetical protein